jgi:hypothetical protein
LKIVAASQHQVHSIPVFYLAVPDAESLQVSADRLRGSADAHQFAFATTAELADPDGIVGQRRAVDAIRFAIEMAHDGYNLFVLGPAGAGKYTVVEQFLSGRAAKEPAPDGFCYVNNFAEPHKPHVLRLPPGRSFGLQQDMRQLVDELRRVIPAAFESEVYGARSEQIDTEFSQRQEKAFVDLGNDAAAQQIALIRTPVGFSLAPTRRGEALTEKEYDELPASERAEIETHLAQLREWLEWWKATARRLRSYARCFRRSPIFRFDSRSP